MPKNEPIRRGPSQEERRRRSANRPIGGGGTPQQLNSRKKDESYGNTRLQRISGIIGIIMLVALLLSLVPACYYSQAGAAELPAVYGHGAASVHLSPAGDHLSLDSAETPLALTAPAASPTNLQVSLTNPYTSRDLFKYWLEHGGASLLAGPDNGTK